MAGYPVVFVDAGGLPVTYGSDGNGWPIEEAASGLPVTIVASGGLPVVEGVGVPAIADYWSADFVNGAYVIEDEASTLAAATDYVRSGTAYADNLAAVYSSFAANAERITDAGILLEAARTNEVRNNSMGGASAPSTYPTNWGQFVGNGLAHSVVGTGTEDGLPYIDIKINGTATSSNGGFIRPEGSTQIVAAPGEVWTLSQFVKVVSGTGAFTAFRFRVSENNAAGTALAQQYGSDIKASLSGTKTRFSGTFTLANASVARLTPYVCDYTFANGAVFDNLVLRFYAPQCEKAASASSPILTTSAAVTRSADALTLKLPAAGTKDLTLTFDNDSQQVIPSVAGGDYAIDPAILDRPRVKTIDWGSV